ncbi:MAG: hypothetical protein HC827_21550, partial [Cyanobacteria bacterium RM1_2_2]|nr:hypothetical protein [Cyanobacteria bacterium RM1_2_2]
MVVQPDGKIVVAGFANNGSDSDFALARYNPNGTLDTSLAAAVESSLPSAAALIQGSVPPFSRMAKIVVAGSAFNGSNFDFALTRYNPNGTLDTSFGSGGKVITPVGSSDADGYSV